MVISICDCSWYNTDMGQTADLPYEEIRHVKTYSANVFTYGLGRGLHSLSACFCFKE